MISRREWMAAAALLPAARAGMAAAPASVSAAHKNARGAKISRRTSVVFIR